MMEGKTEQFFGTVIGLTFGMKEIRALYVVEYYQMEMMTENHLICMEGELSIRGHFMEQCE